MLRHNMTVGCSGAMLVTSAYGILQVGGIMPDRSQNLQDAFLNTVRKSKTPLTIFLVNGVKLQGVVTWFDNFCVLLRRDGQVQLVYKHAISTIMPSGPVVLHDPVDPADEE